MDVGDQRSLGDAGPSLDALAKVLAGSPMVGADNRSSGSSMRRPVRRIRARPPTSSSSTVWLNAWNCRIPYPRDGVDLLVPSLNAWWRKHRRRLVDIPLCRLDDRGIESYQHCTEELIDMPAGINNVGTVRSLAPTASSKLLWVLRPQTACPSGT